MVEMAGNVGCSVGEAVGVGLGGWGEQPGGWVFVELLARLWGAVKALAR